MSEEDFENFREALIKETLKQWKNNVHGKRKPDRKWFVREGIGYNKKPVFPFPVTTKDGKKVIQDPLEDQCDIKGLNEEIKPTNLLRVRRIANFPDVVYFNSRIMPKMRILAFFSPDEDDKKDTLFNNKIWNSSISLEDMKKDDNNVFYNKFLPTVLINKDPKFIENFQKEPAFTYLKLKTGTHRFPSIPMFVVPPTDSENNKIQKSQWKKMNSFKTLSKKKGYMNIYRALDNLVSAINEIHGYEDDKLYVKNNNPEDHPDVTDIQTDIQNFEVKIQVLNVISIQNKKAIKYGEPPFKEISLKPKDKDFKFYVNQIIGLLQNIQRTQIIDRYFAKWLDLNVKNTLAFDSDTTSETNPFIVNRHNEEIKQMKKLITDDLRKYSQLYIKADKKDKRIIDGNIELVKPLNITKEGESQRFETRFIKKRRAIACQPQTVLLTLTQLAQTLSRLPTYYYLEIVDKKLFAKYEVVNTLGRFEKVKAWTNPERTKLYVNPLYLHTYGVEKLTRQFFAPLFFKKGMSLTSTKTKTSKPKNDEQKTKIQLYNCIVNDYLNQLNRYLHQKYIENDENTNKTITEEELIDAVLNKNDESAFAYTKDIFENWMKPGIEKSEIVLVEKKIRKGKDIQEIEQREIAFQTTLDNTSAQAVFELFEEQLEALEKEYNTNKKDSKPDPDNVSPIALIRYLRNIKQNGVTKENYEDMAKIGLEKYIWFPPQSKGADTLPPIDFYYEDLLNMKKFIEMKHPPIDYREKKLSLTYHVLEKFRNDFKKIEGYEWIGTQNREQMGDMDDRLNMLRKGGYPNSTRTTLTTIGKQYKIALTNLENKKKRETLSAKVKKAQKKKKKQKTEKTPPASDDDDDDENKQQSFEEEDETQQTKSPQEQEQFVEQEENQDEEEQTIEDIWDTFKNSNKRFQNVEIISFSDVFEEQNKDVAQQLFDKNNYKTLGTKFKTLNASTGKFGRTNIISDIKNNKAFQTMLTNLADLCGNRNFVREKDLENLFLNHAGVKRQNEDDVRIFLLIHEDKIKGIFSLKAPGVFYDLSYKDKDGNMKSFSKGEDFAVKGEKVTKGNFLEIDVLCGKGYGTYQMAYIFSQIVVPTEDDSSFAINNNIARDYGKQTYIGQHLQDKDNQGYYYAIVLNVGGGSTNKDAITLYKKFGFYHPEQTMDKLKALPEDDSQGYFMIREGSVTPEQFQEYLQRK